jgi:hypothetical protein
VRGNWGGVLWRLVFIGLCSAIVSFGVSFLVAAVLKVVAIPYLSTIISALVSVFVTSIAVTYNYSLYSNLKSLKGGAVVVPEKNDKKVMIFVAILGLVVFPGVLIANIYFVSRVTSNRAINYQPSQGSISYPVGHY